MEEINTQELLTPEEKLRIFSDKLLASIIQKSELCRKNKNHIFGSFEPSMFRDENYLIYSIVFKFRDLGVTLDSEFLEIFLTNNEKMLDSANGRYINLKAFATSEEDEKLSYIGATIKQYVRLQNMPVLDEGEFKLLCEKYKMVWLGIEASKIYSKGEQILLNGVKEGRKYLSGYEDSKSYVNREFSRLEGISSRDSGSGFISMRDYSEEEDTKKIERIAYWGIRELDEHFGGIYTSNFISILAPPKNGKTKLTAQLVHNALMEGTSVVAWVIEGNYKEFNAQLRAKHFDYTYNKDVVDMKKRVVGINVKDIKENNIASERLKQLEAVSKEDLFSNPKYGELTYIDKPCNVETFIDEIDTAVQSSNAKMVAIDYLQLIGSCTNMSETERVAEAYISLLRYCKEKNLTVISPAQYKQEVVADLAKSDGNSEMRVSGGKSGEVVKTPDINIALWATAEDIIRHKMSILSIPSRNAEPFPKFDIAHDLGVCNFMSIAEGA